MIHNKRTFFLAMFVLFVELFLGVPRVWKEGLIIVSALYLVFLSVRVTMPLKKPIRQARKKEKVTPVFVENIPPIVSSSQSPVQANSFREEIIKKKTE